MGRRVVPQRNTRSPPEETLFKKGAGLIPSLAFLFSSLLARRRKPFSG